MVRRADHDDGLVDGMPKPNRLDRLQWADLRLSASERELEEADTAAAPAHDQ
jgi:hypothetical protein